MAEDGVPVPGGHPGGATPSPPVSNVDGLTGEPTRGFIIGTMYVPPSPATPTSGLVALTFGTGTGPTRRLATTDFDALVTSVLEDGDHSADGEEHHLDDSHFVPSGQEEGSGGHAADQERSDVGVPVPRGRLNADAPAFVPTAFRNAAGITSPSPDYRPAITSSALTAGPVHPFIDGQYGMAFGCPLHHDPSTSSSSSGLAGLVPYSSAFPPVSGYQKEWHLDWLQQAMAALNSQSQSGSTASASLGLYSGSGGYSPSPMPSTSSSISLPSSAPYTTYTFSSTSEPVVASSHAMSGPSAVTAPPFGYAPTSAAPYAPTTAFPAAGSGDPLLSTGFHSHVPPSFAGAGPAEPPRAPAPAPPRLGDCKTMLCRHYSRGRRCPRGDACTYAHGSDDLRVVTMGSSPHQAADVGETSSASASAITGVPPYIYYKTRLCTRFMRGGSCLSSVNCTYAHGESELREQPLCRYIFSGERCPHGDTCDFRH